MNLEDDNFSNLYNKNAEQLQLQHTILKKHEPFFPAPISKQLKQIFYGFPIIYDVFQNFKKNDYLHNKIYKISMGYGLIRQLIPFVIRPIIGQNFIGETSE